MCTYTALYMVLVDTILPSDGVYCDTAQQSSFFCYCILMFVFGKIICVCVYLCVVVFLCMC